MSHTPTPEKRRLNEQRTEILQQLEYWLELSMLVLSFIWLALLIIEFVWGMGRHLEMVGTTIWMVVILDFAVKCTRLISSHTSSTTG